MKPEQFELDFGEGKKRKDRGMDRVTGHNEDWNGAVKQEFELWLSTKPEGFEFTAEDFRLYVIQETDVGYPKHPNAWGAFFGHLGNGGLVDMTGGSVLSTSPSNHARRVMIWRKA